MQPSLNPPSGPSPSGGDTPSFQDALRQELKRLLQSGLSAADCLARFPEHHALIQQLQAAGPTQSQETHLTHGDESVSTAFPNSQTDPVSAPGAAAEKLPQQLIGRYQLQKLLGAGAFGHVYLAYDPQLDLSVALKVPIRGAFQFPAERARFLREARAAVAVRHPAICPVYDVGETSDGQCYLALGYIAGESLAQRLARCGPPDQRTAAKWVLQIAEGMAEAHHCGIIHRDLKPANIMLDTRSRPVIMDFGLARRDGSDDAALTQQGQILGTPAYMSPEQARGDQTQVGPQSDIYSLGTIFYELLTGQRPYRGGIVEVLSQLEKSAPRPPRSLKPEIHSGLEQICLVAMAPLSEQRWTSMERLQHELQSWLDEHGHGLAETSTVIVPDTASLLRQRSGYWKYKVLVAVLLTALTGYYAGVFYVSTKEGTVKIDVQDPDIEVRVDGREIEFRHLEQPLKLWVGTHQLEVRHGNILVETRKFEIERGPNRKLTVTYTPVASPIQQVPPSPPTHTQMASPEVATNSVPASVPAVPRDTPDPEPSPLDGAPKTNQHLLAESIIQNGGSVFWRVGTSNREATQLKDLPKQEWSLAGIRQRQSRAWTPLDRERLSEMTEVDYLDLQCGSLTDADYQCFAGLPKLTSLSLTGGQISEVQLRTLAKLKGLTSLQLRDSGITSLEPLDSLKNLTVFWVTAASQPMGGSAGPLSLLPLKSMPNLSDLNLSGISLASGSMAEIARLQHLSRLHLNGHAITDTELLELGGCPRLQAIFLDQTAVTDTGVSKFLEATQARIYGLSVAGSALTSQGLKPLAQCQLLLDLNVADTAVDDKALHTIARCTRMSSLWLTNTQVTDAGLSNLGDLKQLMTLDLTRTAISDASVKRLAQFKKLSYLGIRSTKITAQGFAELREQLPSCHIDW